MREIKFRAWVRGRRGCSAHMLNWEMLKGFPLPVWHKDYNLMQFTGLKDKNGKEIYEEDILEIIEENDGEHGFDIPIGERVIVEWLDSGFGLQKLERVKDRKENDNYCDNCSTWSGTLMSENHEIPIGCFSKVIGNIYENPELLN